MDILHYLFVSLIAIEYHYYLITFVSNLKEIF